MFGAGLPVALQWSVILLPSRTVRLTNPVSIEDGSESKKTFLVAFLELTPMLQMEVGYPGARGWYH